jgi:glutamine synthetase
MTVLNAIMAETLKGFKRDVDALIDKGEKKEIAIMHVIREYAVTSKKVLFERDGYSDEWADEAARRGLPNIKTTPLALDAMISDKAKKLYESTGVFSHAEIEARHEIELEKYIKIVQIEARMMGELATANILPGALRYQNLLIENIKGLKEVGLPESSYANQKKILSEISEHISAISTLVEKMIDARKAANQIENSRDMAIAYCDKVKGVYFDDIRYHVDKLELLVDDKEWTLPKYREILFLR